jgi:hypothetical protein
MASRTEIGDTSLFNVLIRRLLKMESARLTIAGALTLTINHPPILAIDSGGAGRNVLLPLESTAKGLFFFISATNAAGVLTLRNSADSVTYGTIDPGTVQGATAEKAICWCDGVNWYVLTSAGTVTTP